MRTRLAHSITCFTAMLVLTATIGAQAGNAAPSDPPSGGSPPSGKHQRPKPAQELDRLAQAMQAAAVPLSDAQSATILGILQDRATALKALRKSGVTGEDAASQREKLMSAGRASIRAVLTEGQVRVFDNLSSDPSPDGSNPSSASTFDRTAANADALIDANTGGDPHSDICR